MLTSPDYGVERRENPNVSQSSSDQSSSEWYWDLRRGVAVPASERGPGDDMLGPYPTKHAAENWKAKVEERNEAWEHDDEEWDQAGESDDN